jgi:hypothetical protein
MNSRSLRNKGLKKLLYLGKVVFLFPRVTGKFFGRKTGTEATSYGSYVGIFFNSMPTKNDKIRSIVIFFVKIWLNLVK